MCRGGRVLRRRHRRRRRSSHRQECTSHTSRQFQSVERSYCPPVEREFKSRGRRSGDVPIGRESEESFMSTNNEKPFTFRFIDAKPRILLELQNTSEKAYRSVEILTIFLKDEQSPDGAP